MSWRDLLETKENQIIISPWCGGRYIQTTTRGWTIKGRLPREHDWHRFSVKTKDATWVEKVEPDPDLLKYKITGYLVGDRLIPDNITSSPKLKMLTRQFEHVNLLEPGLDRFTRIKAGRVYESGPLVYEGEEFPLGAEDEVLDAFLEDQSSVDFVANVSPALDGAFRYETWRRAEIRRIRKEERIRREKEERMRKIQETLGDGALRRELALTDFGEAAKAALKVGGAEYIDHMDSRQRDEMVVRFRYQNQRFECTCNKRTLRIIDSGICLVNHRTGEKGDTYFTLESLPPVINEARGGHNLVQHRHQRTNQ